MQERPSSEGLSYCWRRTRPEPAGRIRPTHPVDHCAPPGPRLTGIRPRNPGATAAGRAWPEPGRATGPCRPHSADPRGPHCGPQPDSPLGPRGPHYGPQSDSPRRLPRAALNWPS